GGEIGALALGPVVDGLRSPVGVRPMRGGPAGWVGWGWALRGGPSRGRGARRGCSLPRWHGFIFAGGGGRGQGFRTARSGGGARLSCRGRGGAGRGGCLGGRPSAGHGRCRWP